MSFFTKMSPENQLKFMIMAEIDFEKYMREVVGADTSKYPSEIQIAPTLKIQFKVIYYPNKYKNHFAKWFADVYFPTFLNEEQKEQWNDRK